MHLSHVLYRSARHFPKQPLWLAPNLSISYEDGAVRVSSLAHAFLRLAKQRDRVAIVSSNRFEAMEAYLAALAAGMAATPLNPKLHVDEMSFMLNDSGATLFVFSPEFADAARQLRAKHPGVSRWICMDDVEGFDRYSHLLAIQAQEPPKILIEPDDVAWLFYTSGTTGQPKGVMETHRNLVEVIQQLRLSSLRDVDETDRVIHFAPVAHATTTVGLVYLSAGGAQVFPGLSRFDPPQVLASIQAFAATGGFMAPTMVQMLLQCPDVGRYDLSSLRNILCAGAPMYAEVLRRAIEVFGPVFSQGYGQSESPSICGMHKSEYDLSTPEGLKRIASAGRELPGIFMRVVNEDGQEVGPNIPGELTVRGNTVMTGYWNRPNATKEALRDGWLHTGDVGYRDELGYIFITDRVKDMIISGGSNIYPREVEEVLLEHPAISEASVVGAPDEMWGESVKAIVVLRPGNLATEQEVIEFCRARLASYKKPKSVDFVDMLPKNAYGKVMKKELRATYWKSANRSI